MNKLIIDGTEYELEQDGVSSYGSTPSVMVNCKHYVGKAVAKKRAKDYEILTFKDKGPVKFTLEKNNDCTYGPYSCTENDVFNLGYYGISEVRRLSDGEVFSIGDEVKYSDEPNPFTIEYFHISDVGNMMAGVRSYRYSIDYIKKVKPALFTSDDGVDIHEGDTIWYVRKDWSYTDVEIHAKPSNQSCKYFSTQEAAEEFILMNKRCLSVNDVVKKFEDKFSFTANTYYFELKELAKEKINAPTKTNPS